MGLVRNDAMKICSRCGCQKPISDFGTHRKSNDGYQWWCKKCKSGWETERRHRLGIAHPMKDAKNIGMYLGIVIAERALSHVFEHVVKMPHGNPGYDFICGRGYKVDVKSSCLHTKICQDGYQRSPKWKFRIHRNKIAQYFVCLGFNDRESLEPLKMWIIPGEAIQHLSELSITNRPETLEKWEKYERPIDKVSSCCIEMREMTEVRE